MKEENEFIYITEGKQLEFIKDVSYVNALMIEEHLKENRILTTLNKAHEYAALIYGLTALFITVSSIDNMKEYCKNINERLTMDFIENKFDLYTKLAKRNYMYQVQKQINQ